MTIMLKDAVEGIHGCVVHGNPATWVTGVTHDSRKVNAGWMFVAITGEKSDGHDFIGLAVQKGAAAIVAQKPPHKNYPVESAPWVQVPDTRAILGQLSSAVYGQPSSELALTGITGTNGKTTLTYLLESITRAAKRLPGVIGTISYRWSDREISASNTTPESSDLHAMLREMRNSGVSDVFMEVSSHGLSLGRLNGCQFDVGVFTNLTQDHLDYHHDMEDYYQAKKLLFTELLQTSTKLERTAIINSDDPYGARLLSELDGLTRFSFGSSNVADFHPINVDIRAEGISGWISTPRGTIEIVSPLTGSFNLSNIMAAVAVSTVLGFSEESIKAGISNLKVAPGRLQRIESDRGHIFVDYAHTPNALTNVLDALRKSCSGRIITVVGCGGDRDRAKRPLMGEQAALGSDFVVITSDNPRTEDPIDIISQIEPGVKKAGFRSTRFDGESHELESRSFVVIPDRRQAINWIVARIRKDDTLLVAGKGHETYQEINGVRYPFDDSEELRKALDSLIA